MAKLSNKRLKNDYIELITDKMGFKAGYGHIIVRKDLLKLRLDTLVFLAEYMRTGKKITFPKK